MMRGQLANHMRVVCPDPKVGDGVTIFSYTDRSAATVVRVSKSGKTAWIVGDRAERIDDLGMTDSGQKYRYTPGKGPEAKVTLRKDGQWKIVKDGRKVAFGIRDAYHDFSF